MGQSPLPKIEGCSGPVACACDKDGALFVARYDFRENAVGGVISIAPGACVPGLH